MTEKQLEYYREYRRNNLDSIRDYQREYHKEYRKHAKVSPGKRKEYERRYERKHPQRKLSQNIRRRIRNALSGKSKSASTIELIGCTIEEYRLHIEGTFTEGMAWNNYGKWQIDHIIPCASFDLSIEENQYKCFNYKNTQALWASHNRLKGTS